MPHKHNSCTAWDYGAKCFSGVVTGYCDYEECSWIDCVDMGHCECLCHSGKTCDCGHEWPRINKGDVVNDDPDTCSTPILPPLPVAPSVPAKTWAETLTETLKESR